MGTSGATRLQGGSVRRSEEIWGVSERLGQTCSAPARQVSDGGRSALAGEDGDVPVPVPGPGHVDARGSTGHEPQRRPVVEGGGLRDAVRRRAVVHCRLAAQGSALVVGGRLVRGRVGGGGGGAVGG